MGGLEVAGLARTRTGLRPEQDARELVGDRRLAGQKPGAGSNRSSGHNIHENAMKVASRVLTASASRSS